MKQELAARDKLALEAFQQLSDWKEALESKYGRRAVEEGIQMLAEEVDK